MRPSLVLGIETSCDDTACAVVDSEGRVLASVVSSQLAVHRPYGGVVPELASREQLANWPAVYAETLARAGVTIDDIGAIAATSGPGLIGSLLVGLSLGRALAWARGLPFLAVHHLEGHLYSPWLTTDGTPAAPFPERFVGLVVSGGHTSLYRVRPAGASRAARSAASGDPRSITLVAETRDDAFGEAFDKFGKRLGLPYPQGPLLDRLAERGDAAAAPVARLVGTEELFFSYSGLKTQAVSALEKLEARGLRMPPPALLSEQPEAALEAIAQPFLDLAAGFRESAVRQVLDRLTRLHRREPFTELAVSGGAAANRLLRRRLPEWAAERAVALRLVPLLYSGDNAAMIAFAAVARQARGELDDPLLAEAASRLPLGA
ncbi:MAG: tRNA (adenosine(37)-N6)-threonylcarbamoyltransferase complex transferase subunit TsaD [Thermoanaerobaculia bacterium]|jgi:N6-L-threonylcarbamoyladenine synthase|nr:tRNA (adenosine(37)-N6)-threonylcarbamoyltransferase complex transferase subunit TsaD [Thermoanaerobaculia bacterium]